MNAPTKLVAACVVVAIAWTSFVLCGCGGDPFGYASAATGDDAQQTADSVPRYTWPFDSAAEATDGLPDDVAGDSGVYRDASPDAPTDPTDACALVVHDNGMGQTWTDCVAIGTHTEAQAWAACRAHGGCSGPWQSSDPCSSAIVCATGGGSPPCWGFGAPAAAGHVTSTVNPATGVACPTQGDPAWN